MFLQILLARLKTFQNHRHNHKQCLWLSVWCLNVLKSCNDFCKKMVSPPYFAPASHGKTTFCVAHRNESRLQQSRRCLETGFWMKSRCSSQGEAIKRDEWRFGILKQNIVNITIDRMQYFQNLIEPTPGMNMAWVVPQPSARVSWESA